MGGLFGGGSKKSSGSVKEIPAPTIAAPAPAVDPNVVASDAKRRTSGMSTPTLMSEGVPRLESAKPRETLGGG